MAKQIKLGPSESLVLEWLAQETGMTMASLANTAVSHLQSAYVTGEWRPPATKPRPRKTARRLKYK